MRGHAVGRHPEKARHLRQIEARTGGEPGPRESGTDDRYRDTGAAVLLADRLAEAVDERLARPVDGRIGGRLQAGTGRYVEDRATSPLSHAGKRRRGEAHDG